MSTSYDCTACGACCCFFRVSLHWLEAEDKHIPPTLLAKTNEHVVHMVGTSSKKPRCVALIGEINKEVKCGIYEKRPEVCKIVEPGSEQCLKARLAHHI